jgi:hypothetical protein
MECVVKTIVRIRKFLKFILAVSHGVDVKRAPTVRFKTSNTVASAQINPDWDCLQANQMSSRV